MKTYSYIRKDYPVSTVKQMEVAMKWTCDTLIIENADLEEDEELNKLLASLEEKDKLIIYDLTVFGKSFLKLKDVFEVFAAKNIQLIMANKTMDITTGDFYSMAGELMVMEEKIRRDKTSMRIQKAKANGGKFGRPKISDEKMVKIQDLYFGQKMTLRKISNECEVSLGTVHKYINMDRKQVLRV